MTPPASPHHRDLFDHAHRHTVGCFWDHQECRWRCGRLGEAGARSPRTTGAPAPPADGA